jgi:hypothetical protein
MTVEFSFRPNDLALRDVRPDDPEDLFGETILRVEVRFVVNGRDVFPPIPGHDDGWDEQPLIGFVTRLRGAAQQLRSARRVSIYMSDFPYLHVERVSRSDISIRVGRTGDRFRTCFDDFAEAVEGLVMQVETWIRECNPRLAGHPAWSLWFPEVARDIRRR